MGYETSIAVGPAYPPDIRTRIDSGAENLHTFSLVLWRWPSLPFLLIYYAVKILFHRLGILSFYSSRLFEP